MINLYVMVFYLVQNHCAKNSFTGKSPVCNIQSISNMYLKHQEKSNGPYSCIFSVYHIIRLLILIN